MNYATHFLLWLCLQYVFCTMKHAIRKTYVNELTHNHLALMNNLKTLLHFGSSYSNIDWIYH